MNKNKVVLNVGGKRFETLESTLRRIPGTMLGRIDRTSPYYDASRGEFFFDRDPFIFTSVLNLYRIGELHLPHNTCGPAIKRELLFWEVDENVISECCWRFYKAFEEEQGRLVRIRNAFGFNKSAYGQYPGQGSGARGPHYWRFHTWKLLSDPMSSMPAKIWACFYFMLLLLSCIIQILRTEPALRSTKYDNATDKILLLFTGCDADTTSGQVIRVTEDILTVFFTVELMLRFGVCGDKKCFARETLNWIDAVCVFPMLSILVMRIIIEARRQAGGDGVLALTYASAYMSVTALLRVLRLLKVVQHVIGFKILILTLKASMKEILLLMGLISLGTVLFAVSVYIAEIFDRHTDFPTISDGLWWAIITMTTVGYGDLKPKSAVGRLIGTLCAMSGILATGLAIPVIASNFDKFYSDAQVLKQARLTEGRPKNAEMRRRAKDPFGPIGSVKYPASTEKRSLATAAGEDDGGGGVGRGGGGEVGGEVGGRGGGGGGGEVGGGGGRAVGGGDGGGDVPDAIVVPNRALTPLGGASGGAGADLKVTANGVAMVTPKRRFSLGSMNNVVAPLRGSCDGSRSSPIHKSRSSFLSTNATATMATMARDEMRD